MKEDLGTILQISQLVVYLAGAILFVIMTRADLKVVKHDLKTVFAQHTIFSNTLNNISDTLTKVAVQDSRLNRAEQDIRDLKQGKGFVTNNIDGEYVNKGKVRS